jgi:hypothetical protein
MEKRNPGKEEAGHGQEGGGERKPRGPEDIKRRKGRGLIPSLSLFFYFILERLQGGRRQVLDGRRAPGTGQWGRREAQTSDRSAVKGIKSASTLDRPTLIVPPLPSDPALPTPSSSPFYGLIRP